MDMDCVYGTCKPRSEGRANMPAPILPWTREASMPPRELLFPMTRKPAHAGTPDPTPIAKHWRQGSCRRGVGLRSEATAPPLSFHRVGIPLTAHVHPEPYVVLGSLSMSGGLGIKRLSRGRGTDGEELCRWLCRCEVGLYSLILTSECINRLKVRGQSPEQRAWRGPEPGSPPTLLAGVQRELDEPDRPGRLIGDPTGQ